MPAYNRAKQIIDRRSALLKKYFLFALTIFVMISPLVLAGCSGNSSQKGETPPSMVSMADMPAEVRAAPATVQQAYQFAAEHQDIVKRIPCYCGCGAMGHKSSYSCYISSVGADHKITYDTHALGCSICVDITQDTMRLLKQGKTVAEIKTIVDQTYSQYGPSNMP
jgi:hypothetical protein